MLSTLTGTPASIPATVDEHPRVIETQKDLGALQAKAQDARDAHDQLRRERASLDGSVTTALLSLGRVKQKDVDDRAAQLDAEIEKAGAEVNKRDIAVRQLEADFRGAREQAAAEIKIAVVERTRELMARIDREFADVGRLAAEIESMRAQHPTIDLPRYHNYLLGGIERCRVEAREFGTAI